ncbi:hypothetical protein OQH60_08455, partial [Campylobacter sp. MIT 21-1685]|uniref:hypothetical protein n=1 Tax=unclassified Campylobacter TaxID=2593542 RepID=UPI00224AE22B
YGGLYVFDKKLRDEMIEREKEREELREKVTTGDTFWEQIKAIDKTHPQTLSNGYKYHNQAFGYYEKQFEPYYQKIKEYMGEQVYNTLKPSIILLSFYRDDKGEEFPLTFLVSINWLETKYGIFGDEGRGIRFSQKEAVTIDGDNIFYLINNTFVREKDTQGAVR